MISAAARQMMLVALLLATVLGLFVAAEVGHRKLEEVRRQVERGAQREQALAEVLQLLSQAESSQRGSILLGDAAYLEPYQEAVTKSLSRCVGSSRRSRAPTGRYARTSSR